MYAHLCAKVQASMCVCVCETTLVYFPSYHSVTVMYGADQTKVSFTVTGRENGLLRMYVIRCEEPSLPLPDLKSLFSESKLRSRAIIAAQMHAI